MLISFYNWCSLSLTSILAITMVFQIQGGSALWTSYWWKCWSWRRQAHILYLVDILKWRFQKQNKKRYEQFQRSFIWASGWRGNCFLWFKEWCYCWGESPLLHPMPLRHLILKFLLIIYELAEKHRNHLLTFPFPSISIALHFFFLCML